MTAIAVIAIALAGVCFCVMHIVARVLDRKDRQDSKNERLEVKKELENEILNGGNVAHISQLYRRLQELDSE